jgi:Cu/Ag efflux protein CusF
LKTINHNAATLLVMLLAILLTSCQKQNNLTKSASPTPGTATSAPGPPGFPPPVLNKPYPGTGVVADINRSEGWIEINHQEIKGLMPAMQMEFNVKDKSLLRRLIHVSNTIASRAIEGAEEAEEILARIEKSPNPTRLYQPACATTYSGRIQ